MGQESAKIGPGKAFKEGWIKKDRDILKANVRAMAFVSEIIADSLFQRESIADTSREQLQTIQSTRTHPDPKILNDLKKRKLVTMHKVISYKFSKGPKYARNFVKEETDLTADMLAR